MPFSNLKASCLMTSITRAFVALSLIAVASCTSFQPHQITRQELSTGNPPLTGTLPNGVMEDSPWQ